MDTYEGKNAAQLLSDFENVANALVKGGEPPMDGDLYANTQYLKTLTGVDKGFYRRYLLQMSYFTSLHNFEGISYDFTERFLRQLIEFGRCAVIKIKGKLIPIAPVDVKLNIDGTVKELTGLPVREGYGYHNKQKTIRVRGKECVLVKANFQALPFVWFWRDVILNHEKLLKIALTGSTNSIKKMVRKLYNNDTELAAVENKSLVDPSSPVVNVIANPISYQGIQSQGKTGSQDQRATMGNVFEPISGQGVSPKELFETLDSYLQSEYFMLGRRVNTNKKADRNISAEVDTEVVNFEVLDTPMEAKLKNFAEEVSKKLKINIKYVSRMKEIAEENGGTTAIKETKVKKGMFSGRKDKV